MSLKNLKNSPMSSDCRPASGEYYCSMR